MNAAIQNIIKKTPVADRLAVINQFRHDYQHQCVCETRVQCIDECNYLCEIWGYEHCKIEETAIGLVDRKTVQFAKLHSAETTDHDFDDLMKTHNFNPFTANTPSVFPG